LGLPIKPWGIGQKELTPYAALLKRLVAIDVTGKNQIRITGQLIGRTIARGERAPRGTHIEISDSMWAS